MKSPQSSAAQRGSTLTGLIIGLVIGLGIAVAVALLINKSSTPFMNKGVKDKPDQPVSQLGDPNKPLFGGKEPAKDAAGKPAETRPVETPPQVAVVKAPEVKTEAPKEKPADAAKAADPVKVEAAADDKYTYYLQTGAFKEQADAESARARLALIGFEAKISEKNSDTGTLYRVRTGPYPNAEAMNRQRTKLSENGVDVAIVKTLK